MPAYTSPPEPLPGPLDGRDVHSFAHDTVVRRLPNLLNQTTAENDFSPSTLERFQRLSEEIPFGKVRLLDDPHAPDEGAWNRYLQPYLQQNWLEIPWFLAEAYFFRRIVEATGYFAPGEGQGFDPYQYQKAQALEHNQTRIAAAAEQVEAWLKDSTHRIEAIQGMLLLNIWGNQADLSLWPVGGEQRPDHAQQADQQAHLLVDDREPAARYLCAETKAVGSKRVDFVIDNAGLELTLDLCLADLLLSTSAAERVRLHLKGHPTFISDALTKDVLATVETLVQSSEPAVSGLGERLQSYIASQRLELVENLFWNSPNPAWEMPAELRTELAQAHLVISKGDMNYRRLLGDRHWDHTTAFAEILRYFPTAVLAMRVLKSEVCVGLQASQIAQLEAQEAQWLTNGRWGVIQFAENNHDRKAGS